MKNREGKSYKKRSFIAFLIAAVLAGFGLHSGPEVVGVVTELVCQPVKCEQ